MVSAYPHRSRNARRDSSQRVWIIYAAAVCAAAILLPLVLSQFDYSSLKVFLATALLGLCFYPAAHYFANPQTDQPAFAVLCISYAVQFAVPVFTREPVMKLVHGSEYLSDADVITALALSILGVGALQLGFYQFKINKVRNLFPSVNLALNEKRAIVYCVTMFALPFSVNILIAVLPPEFSGILTQLSALLGLLQNQLLVIIGVLGWIVYSGRGTVLHRVLLYGIVVITVLRGISGASLEQVIVPIVVLFLTQWLHTKRMPLKNMVLVAVVIIFLSPVKGEVRAQTWYSSDLNNTSSAERVLLWVGQASEYWMETLSGERSFVESTASSANRTDLIHQFTYMYTMTPQVIPYKYGATYSYFAVAWIPRFMWPDKPEAGIANRNFSVEYNITTSEIAQGTTFGMSLLGEGYINFGIIGVAVVMALQGVLLSLLEHIFGSYKSGAGGQAVFLAFYVYLFNGVGSSAEILFGNVFQTLAVSCILLWWAREKPTAVRAHAGIARVPSYR